MHNANASVGSKDLFDLVEEVVSRRVNYVEYIRPINEAEVRDLFLADIQMIYPPYRYKVLDEQKLGRRRAKILANLEEVRKRADLPDELRESFIKDLGQSWYHTELISASYDFNNGIEKARAKRRFQRASDAALGRMHEDTFWSLLRERVAFIDKKRLSENEQIIYREMLSMIGVMGRNRKKHYKPKPETIRKFKKMLDGLFGSVLRHIPEDQQEFTVPEAANIINEIIDEELHIPYRAEVDDNILTAITKATDQRIYLPGAREKNYSRVELEKIIVHELGVHVLRAVTKDSGAGNLPVILYPKSGMYSRLTDEGLAKACEQAIDGKFDDLCVARYLAIGLAQVCKKNFRQTFEILWRLEYLACGRSRENSFGIVQRVFRGTGVLPINADLAYYRGYVSVWKFIELHIDDGELLMRTLFLSGKNDFLEQKRETLLQTMREDGLID